MAIELHQNVSVDTPIIYRNNFFIQTHYFSVRNLLIQELFLHDECLFYTPEQSMIRCISSSFLTIQINFITQRKKRSFEWYVHHWLHEIISCVHLINVYSQDILLLGWKLRSLPNMVLINFDVLLMVELHQKISDCTSSFYTGRADRNQRFLPKIFEIV